MSEMNKATEQFSVTRMRSQIERLQEEMHQLNEDLSKKDENIKELRQTLATEEKKRTFELGEIQKGNFRYSPNKF